MSSMHVHVIAQILLAQQQPRCIPKLYLLDRDGVINHDIGDPGVLKPSDLALTPNAAKSIGKVKRNSCNNHVAVITNQSCVGKKLITDAQLDDIHQNLKQLLLEDDADSAWDSLHQCTSTDNSDVRRKPNPGMIFEAMSRFQVQASECVMIGDSIRDLEAATNAGVPLKVLVRTGYGGSLVGEDDLGWLTRSSTCSTDADADSAISVGAIAASEADDAQRSSHQIPESVLPIYVAENLSCAIDW
eukprot:CAMPEP_0116018730 /NCGR_PEP_ID=MMETSP0321-20121206/8818_1 /TAXON_ID=163516 /ORGANISM="Leptocylindrus danicus var. danicus, Strain B650" /LENGTH=243 /DNA_ID=CAMNT_0003489171 /DNA_START=49 /DNA_END=777 /DNA_ORIENTATION=+